MLGISSCDGDQVDGKPYFGDLPYALPTVGGLRQSIALTRDLPVVVGTDPRTPVEAGCVTYAEITCRGANVTTSITFWRSCENDRAWKTLPANAYTLKGGVCAFESRKPPVATLCLGGRCDDKNECQLVTTNLSSGWTEEDECRRHATGKPAGMP
jgi:hypothetical protein